MVRSQALETRWPPPSWRAFGVAAPLAAVAAVAFVLWLVFRIGGDTTTIAVDDIGEAVAALVAALACGLAARRSAGRLRLAWTLLAASAASWGAGEVVWSVNEVGLGVALPYPSVADAGFLAAVPIAVAGVLAFSTAPRGTSTSWRVWLDGTIIAVSLLFVGWALGLNQVYADTEDPFVERVIDLAYPVGDILIGTVLILAIRRASNQQQGRMLLLLGGLAANSLADSAFAYLTATGNYGAIGSVLDAGWVIGYLMIALAALWPSGRVDVTERAPIDLWQLALPWMAVLAAGLSAMIMALSGRPFDAFLSVLAGILAVVLMISQVLAHKDSLSMLIKSRLSESTLAEVISHAPVGVVRVGPDMRIIGANPRFGAFLGNAGAAQAGVSLADHFSGDEAAAVKAKFQSLSSGAEEAVEGDSEAVRQDGTRVWLHWSATAVRKAGGGTDYFIAMFDDTTARHRAEAAAAANLTTLERLNQVKTEFLETTRHEFRSALVGIQGFSELIRDVEHLNVDEVKEFAADIYTGARDLDQMINEMLELDRAETSGAILHIGPMDLNAAVGEVVARIRTAVERPIIDIDLDPNLPAVLGDAEKVSEVLQTLLGNAIKYSPEGERILISSRLKDREALVTVKDQGMGPRADFDNRLFGQDDLYANSPIRKVVGTGLGLAIARQVVELHGGRIWVDRNDGVGSDFHFTLPVHSPSVKVETPLGAGGRVG
ncbi:PAS domain S-box protein [bacterium]|nr:MAG: PAS domain S-box protein [bacterium]